MIIFFISDIFMINSQKSQFQAKRTQVDKNKSQGIKNIKNGEEIKTH